MDFILIKPVLSGHVSYVILFQCSFARSYKTGLTVPTNGVIIIPLPILAMAIKGAANKNIYLSHL